MNLKDVEKAMEQLRAAKAEIAKLQKQRDDAEKTLQTAKAEVKSTESAKEESFSYSDKTYWEDRYAADVRKAADDKVYEWYVEFSAVQKLISEDLKKCTTSRMKPLVMVSGCGNSTFCEDLCGAGMGTVHGMDYSATVIATMQERAKTGKYQQLQYFQADARNMHEVASSAYDAVLDKGTLDAIVTGGATGGQGAVQQAQAEDAANYMLELWRVLRVGGVLLLITTMPPEILEPVAIAPLSDTPSVVSSSDQMAGKGGVTTQKAGALRSTVCDWNAGCRVQPLTTPEGGQVYYYALTKTANCKKVTSFKVAVSKTAPTSSKEDIMAGISALLEEAVKAKEQMEAASAQQARAQAECRSAEQKKAMLEERLEQGVEDMGADAADEGDPDVAREKDSHIQRAVEQAVRGEAAEVRLFLDEETSTLAAEGTVEVHYVLRVREGSGRKAGESLETAVARAWNEDDTLCLVCVASTEPPAAGDEVMYRVGEQGYEVFEYTEPARVVSAAAFQSDSADPDCALLSRIGAADLLGSEPGSLLIGKASIRLPSYACSYHVSYIRTLTLPLRAVSAFTANSAHGTASAGKVVQRRVRLARTEGFSVRTHIYGAHPDARGLSLDTLFAQSHQKSSVANVRRRGAGPLKNSCLRADQASESASRLEMWVEDMSRIHTLCVTARLHVHKAVSSTKSNRVLTRAMAWATAAPTGESATASNAQQPALQVFVEVDVVSVAAQTSSGGARAEAVRTICGILEISDAILAHASIDLTRASALIDQQGRLQCRFPYTPHSAAPSSCADIDGLNKLATALQASPDASLLLRCQLCGADVLDKPNDIRTCRPLPTGLLDNMIHDFICCEELPQGSLTSAELETPASTLLHGEHYVSVHPSHLRAAAVQVQCKAAVTQLDVLTGCGGTIATSHIPLADLGAHEKTQKILQAFKAVINIDTCALRCTRCDAYLGDAQLRGEACQEQDCVTHPAASSGQTASIPSTDSAVPFTLADLRDVRFALSAVRMGVQSLNDCAGVLVKTSAEQAVARTLLHMSAVYGIAAFLLYVGDGDLGASGGGASPQSMGVVLKIVSKDFRSSAADLAAGNAHPTTPALGEQPLRVSLQSGVKVAFLCGRVLDIFSGVEARIPLQMHELQEVSRLLEERAPHMSASPFPGRGLSFLNL